jgi:hypothetical protein
MKGGGQVRTDLWSLEDIGNHLDTRLPDVERKWGKGTILLKTPTVRDLLMYDYLKIRDKNRRLVSLLANRAQKEYEQGHGQKNIVLKARQLGITTYVAARFFLETITHPGTLSVQVAHDQESAEEIFKVVHRFWENLPKEVRRKRALRTSRANVRQLVFPDIDSEYRVETAADPNAGRGLTIHNLHCSEVARWPRDGAETLASLRSAVPQDGEIVLESTPNGAGGVFYEEWQRADETGSARHFFPWWYEDSYTEESAAEALTEEERELMARVGINARQIAWRRRNRSTLRQLSPQEFAEDPRACFLASGECVFELAEVTRRMEGCLSPLENRDNRRLLTWWPPQKTRQYIIGVDPAGGGTGGDYSAAQVIDRATAMQCAELQGHYPPRELAKRVAELARIYNNALLVVERNNHGHAVLAYLHQTERYRYLFEQDGQLGWLTTAVTRPAMVENFAAVLASAPHLFHSLRLLGECRTFVRQADGTTAASAGAYDDCVLAMAIALAGRQAVAGKMGRPQMEELTWVRPVAGG